MSELAGLSYPRLVPSSLLPPEDPSDAAAKRTVRDWIVDVLALLLSAGFGLWLYSDAAGPSAGTLSGLENAVDLLLGAGCTVALWWRRRWPIGVAVITALGSIPSASAGAAALIALFTVTVHRRTSIALSLGMLCIAASVVFSMYRPQGETWWHTAALSAIVTGIVVAWGMFVRARRQLIWILRARAERAEAEQRLRAEQARLAERTRIAREMHDVLAHRISLLALHAGGLQVRPDLPAAQVAATAELLRTTAHRALEELRSVIGVLRENAEGEPAQPQPTLRDIGRLIDDTKRAGAKVTFRMAVPHAAEPPDALGRDAYRIVQEALTNVAKHARGTATTVEVDGGPGTGLHVLVRNRMPVGVSVALPIPGSGNGLLGLSERVTLAGGTLSHGPTDEGEFVVDAWLAWPV